MVKIKDCCGNFKTYTLEETIAMVMDEIGKNIHVIPCEPVYVTFDTGFNIMETTDGNSVVVPSYGDNIHRVSFTLPLVKALEEARTYPRAVSQSDGKQSV